MPVESAVKKKTKRGALSGVVPVKVREPPAAEVEKEGRQRPGALGAKRPTEPKPKPASNPKAPSLKETPPTQRKKPEFAPPKSGGGEVFDVSAEFAKEMAKKKKGRKPEWML